MSKENKIVTIYTDGGADPNPGLGGWAAVMQYDGRMKELSGGEHDTTNNRMELTAAIEALSALKRPCRVVLYTDSQYLQRGVTEWMPNWKHKNWTRGRNPVKNVDLWKQLDALVQTHAVDWRWVRGHTGVELNERCDMLVHQARARLRGC